MIAATLIEVLNNIDSHLSDLDKFITRFENIITKDNVNFHSTADKEILMDVPAKMPDEKMYHIQKQLGIIDRLINTRREEIDNLFKEAWKIEASLNKSNPEYNSVIKEKLAEFNKLKNSYKH